MIVNIAGTSGAGKTHLMRAFLDWVRAQHSIIEPQFIKDRKEPIGYDIRIPGFKRKFHVVGSYGTADTAGCDTIRDVVWVYNYIRGQHEQGKHVIYEGLFVMNMTRGPQLAAEFVDEFHVIQLAVPFAVCVESINTRRAARNEGELLTKDNTKGNFVRANNYCDKMRAVGVNVVRVKRQDALDELLRIIGVKR